MMTYPRDKSYESLSYMKRRQGRVDTTWMQGRRHIWESLGQFPSYLLQATDKGLALTVLEASDTYYIYFIDSFWTADRT